MNIRSSKYLLSYAQDLRRSADASPCEESVMTVRFKPKPVEVDKCHQKSLSTKLHEYLFDGSRAVAR